MSRKKRETPEGQRVSVDARTARRKVSAWLVRDVGNLLMGGEPEYVAGERPVWRVPVVAPHSRQGRATFVDVDAQTGDLLVTDDTPQKVLAYAMHVVPAEKLDKLTGLVTVGGDALADSEALYD